MKSPFHAAAIALTIAVGAQYTIIDEQGHVVGSLVTDTPAGAQLRVIGLANAKRTGTFRGTRSARGPHVPPRLRKSTHRRADVARLAG